MRLTTVTSLLSLLIGSSAFARTVTTPAAPAAATTPVEDEPQTVTGGLRNGPMQISGWFVAPTFTTSTFDGSLAYSPGIRGGKPDRVPVLTP